MLALGLPLSMVVGLALGLLGGGGSILTLPLLVSVLGVQPETAIVMSLVVVAATSAAGAALAWRHGHVDAPVALTFGPASVSGALLGAQLTPLVPAAVLPRLFGIAMLAVAIAMLRPIRTAEPPRAPTRPLTIAAAGLGIGVFTERLGATR